MFKKSLKAFKFQNCSNYSNFKFFSSKDPYINNLCNSRLKLNDLRDNKGARKKKRKKGRGKGSGRGSKSGRGNKGQKAHSNNFPISYIGGSKPLHLKIPKKGGLKKKNFISVVSLDKIGSFIDEGRLNAQKPITIKVINDSGLCKVNSAGVKILRGKKYEGLKPDAFFHHKVWLEASQTSKEARETVERFGGKIILRYFNKVALKAHLYPWKVEFLPRTNGVPPASKRAQFEFPQNQFEKKQPKLYWEFDSDGELPFEEKVKACELNGENEKLKTKLNSPRAAETEKGRSYRLRKKKFYSKKANLLPIPKDIRNDPLKMQLFKMKSRLNFLD